MNYLFRFVFTALLLFSLLLSVNAYATWTDNPAVNTPVAALDDFQLEANSTEDGNGGMFTVWRDNRDGPSSNDIYAQRIDAQGRALWTEGGIRVAGNSAIFPRVVSDNSGGVIVVWLDERGSENSFYAQRLNGMGAVLWAANGVRVEELEKRVFDFDVIADGNGGFIIGWTFEFSTGDRDVQTQRVDSMGARQWGSVGVTVSNPLEDQEGVKLLSDKMGGAYYVWEDYRNGDIDIYAQRVSQAGTALWQNNGIAIDISISTDSQVSPQIVSDGNQGFIVAYRQANFNNGTSILKAERVDGSGNSLWSNIVFTDSIMHSRDSLVIAADGAGGVFASWNDIHPTNNTLTGIYAQRLNENGVRQWQSSGVPVRLVNPANITLISQETLSIKLVSDGVVIGWQEGMGIMDNDLYTQKLSFNGVRQWRDSSVLVGKSISLEQASMVGDNAGGVLFAFSAERDPVRSLDIYAQRVFKSGILSPGDLCFPILSKNNGSAMICL